MLICIFIRLIDTYEYDVDFAAPELEACDTKSSKGIHYLPIKDDCNSYRRCSGKKDMVKQCPPNWVHILNDTFVKKVIPCKDPSADTQECYHPLPTKTPPITTSKKNRNMF